MTWWEKALAWITGRRTQPSFSPATAEECLSLCWKQVDPETFGKDTPADLGTLLTAELGLMIYDGLTADAAFVLLTEPREQLVSRKTGATLTSMNVIKALGVLRGRDVLAEFREVLGGEYDAVMGAGLRLDSQETSKFLSDLIGVAATFSEADQLGIEMLAHENQVEVQVARYCVAANGITGLPNAVPRSAFDASWKAVRG